MNSVEINGYIAEKLEATGKDLNKWVIRIGVIGEFNRSMYQWNLNYKAKGEHPRKIRSKRDGEDVPFSIVEKAFVMLFENKTYDDKVENVGCKMSTNKDSKNITNIPSGTNNATRNSHSSGAKCTTRNDILLAIVNNSNGDKDILMRVMDMLDNTDADNYTSEVASTTGDIDNVDGGIVNDKSTLEVDEPGDIQQEILEIIEECDDEEPIEKPRKVRGAR